ncbi:Disease resistance protein [Cynara cardunculus var. scolymus]|uniref:Disease resistance protein n=1 Tax=Cynara cardunculus var. scolymus TaxID=59895 RepID=A0A118K0Z9_CYNCS|nr:Disease resistance protein [Cynara cardunculus var. scolymus]
MAMLVDPLLSESISKLLEIVISVAKTTANFKPQLEQLKITLERIGPIIYEIRELDRKLDRSKEESEMFVYEIQDARKLVRKCLKIKRNLIKRFTHSLKLKDLDQKLLRFFQIEVQASQSRDIKQTLVEVNRVSDRMETLATDVRNLGQTLSKNSSMSMSFSREHETTLEREKLGWRVPTLPRGIVAFEKPLENLKAMVLADKMDCDDGSVMVVSAPGGCGKTTLVTMLCYDAEIQAKFGERIFFVTVSETPNFLVFVNDLLNPNSFAQQAQSQIGTANAKQNSIEDTKNKLENFLREKVSGPLLLVLDDVWSDSFIENFAFNITGYTILVTSRMVFPKHDMFQFDPLSDEDAKILFHRSAFPEGRRPRPTIHKDLVNQMVKCCKKHPLTLSVVGSSLDGKDETAWRYMLKLLSQGQSVLDLNVDILNRLERSFQALDDRFKECFLDFGLFPEDQRIPATALLNILRKDPGTVNFCEQQFVTQHDLLRQLAINLSSKVALAQRTRLIISAHGEDLPTSISKVKEPMQARILSISTGESFASRWCNMEVPEVEVLVLNLMSKTYTLPYFFEKMQKLKVLNVTNYGLYPTEFENFHLLGCLSNLTRIRLERVTISSLSGPTLALVNLQKISFIMCKIGNAFEKLSSEHPNIWPRLVEIEMDYCQDLLEFPAILCSSVHLKNVSITNCNEMCGISEEFGKLTSLETLSLCSCTKLEKLPESVTRLEKLSIVDISDCLSLSELPKEIGKLSGLRTINMKGCTGVHEIPTSVKELSNTQVICNEEISYQWQDFSNVEVIVVEEDRLESLMRII